MPAFTTSSGVALVDDDDDCRVLLSRLVRVVGGGGAPAQFANGVAVVAFLKSLLSSGNLAALPSVIFLDLNMPHMNGFQVLEWIRLQPELRKMVRVALSSSSSAEDVTRARASGAHCYLVKFPSPETIRALFTAAETLGRLRVGQAVDPAEDPTISCLPFPTPSGHSQGLRGSLDRTG